MNTKWQKHKQQQSLLSRKTWLLQQIDGPVQSDIRNHKTQETHMSSDPLQQKPDLYVITQLINTVK